MASVTKRGSVWSVRCLLYTSISVHMNLLFMGWCIPVQKALGNPQETHDLSTDALAFGCLTIGIRHDYPVIPELSKQKPLG